MTSLPSVIGPLPAAIAALAANETTLQDGHDVAALQALMKTLPFDGSKPSCIISHTVKGKGIAVAEGNPEWHHKSKISAKELADLYAELEG